MNKTVVDIKGMHCRSCELLVEDELTKISNIKSVNVNNSKGTAEIEYDGELDPKEIEKAITCAGYSLGKDEKPYLSKNPHDWRDLGIALFIVLDLFLVAKALGLTNINLTSAHNYNSLPVVFLIGITAGVSTCMALVGGLVLGASARFAEKHPTATPAEKFKPHLFFNLGRIASYTILGGVIGFAGSFFQLSNSFLGVLIMTVGAVMLLLGAQLVEVFPFLKGVTFTLPKEISRFFGIKEQSNKEYSHTNAALMGAGTFFLPCGFTQAMQLFAMSSGSPVTGALTLGTFALGTAPGLLGMGGLTSVIKGTAARLFFRTAGVVVILLAVFNINNGYNLSGLDVLAQVGDVFGPPTFAASAKTANIQNGVQTINMDQTSNGYSPNSFTVTAGVPVRWVINSIDPHSCAASIVSSKLNIRKTLDPGQNVIEFTPTEVGAIKFTCSMGMYQGVFNVIAAGGNTAAIAPAVVAQAAAPAPKAGGGSCGGGGGGCGCGGGGKTVTPVVAPAAATEGNIQVIKTTYTSSTDISPNQFNLKAGRPARFEVLAKDNGSGCMGSITVPGLTDKVDLLTAGKTSVFEFTPKAGKYKITCAMGVPRGEINVN